MFGKVSSQGPEVLRRDRAGVVQESTELTGVKPDPCVHPHPILNQGNAVGFESEH